MNVVPAAEAYVNRGRRDYADRRVGLTLRRQGAEWNRTRCDPSSWRRSSPASFPSYADQDRSCAARLKHELGPREVSCRFRCRITC
jgi:hypothetical protein